MSAIPWLGAERYLTSRRRGSNSFCTRMRRVRRSRLLRDLQQNAEWVEEAESVPPLSIWTTWLREHDRD